MAKHKSKGGHVELPADVAVLPLRDVVVYPHMVIPLFVGREKSIRALDYATQNDQPVLLVAQRSAAEGKAPVIDAKGSHGALCQLRHCG